MENILFLVEGTKIDMTAIDFACYIAKLTHSKLNVIFLEKLEGGKVPELKQLYGIPYVETITAFDLPENREKRKQSQENEKLFAEACLNRGVNYQIQHNLSLFPNEVTDESRFADLLIINAELLYEKKNEGFPSQFVKEILSRSECPVLIAPFSFHEIEEVLFAYDGSKSSVYSIKQFIHLFPELLKKKVTVLHIEGSEGNLLNQERSCTDLLSAHFQEVAYEHLKGKASDELFGYLLEKKHLFVVMGAYGRGMLSSIFRKSTADLLLKTINLPIFIAHN